MLSISHWHHLYGKPEASAQFKTRAEDFRVIEDLGYAPIGEGEHVYVWLRKCGLNTAFVAEQLAKFLRLPLRAITYAGRKDKHALTEQWFGIHLPGKTIPDFSGLPLEGVEILNVVRHNRKLRTGSLRGNQFVITLRDVTSTSNVEARLQRLQQSGVPNYFGPQRFGDTRHHPQGGNLALAEKMLQGEAIKNRNKRSMAISALRAWLFNETVSQRIETHGFDTPLSGDTMLLRGSNSFFVATDITEEIQQRLSVRDISPGAPLWGKGELPSEADTRAFEQSVAGQHPALCEGLEALGLKQERRPIRLFAENIHWKIDGHQMTITFNLPAGSFATSVLREAVQLVEQESGE